ncbi:MAG: hypothetical protein EBU26_17300, partial [Verrucomicrobia bacterium]|nr:hypothetical protein [Verrucomicrobiota bacterium]
MAGEMMMWTKKRPTSVVSIEWGYGFLSLEWVRKNGRQPHAQAKATVTLPADYLQQTPASLGAMVRQALESNGIREKQCLVTLPIGALFSARTEVPPLEEEDLQSFFDTQAEREFPFPLEGLRVSRAAFSGADGKSHVLMMALAWAGVALGLDDFSSWFNSHHHHMMDGSDGGAIFSQLGHEERSHLMEETLLYHFGKTAEILIFLMGAMTIVEIIDHFDGFA